MTVTLAMAGGLAISSGAAADDYQWEAGAGFNRFSLDDQDLDYWSLRGTYYFRPVKTDALPLQEAAYLGRASSISLAPSRLATGFGNFDQWRLSSDVYIPKYWLYLSAGFTHSDTVAPTYNGMTIVANRGYDTTWDATLGITPFDGLRISTSFYEHTDYQPNLDVKYVGKLGNDHFYGFGIDLIDPDHGDLTYGMSADYYVDRTLRVGLELGEHNWGVSADKFFAEKFSVGLRYAAPEAGHTLGLKASWRF